jgi:predicted lipase
MDLTRELEVDDDEPTNEEPQVPRRSSGELRSAAKGIVSRASMLDFGEAVEPKKKQKRRISFDEDTIPLQTDDSTAANRMSELVFSNREIESNLKNSREEHKDILSEGQIYLGISMLVYMYSHLRETVRQGLTRVRMEDIDVHSCHSQYSKRRKIKYLSKTKTAGSIIRVVIDELDGEDENDADHELLSGEGKEYEKSQTAQFRKWIEDSKVSQLDKETEDILVQLRRKVARHRWKRAISAVRLSYKLSGGKRPNFEGPVAAPGCENENRFVDLNQMMSEAVRQQPKYFKEGSIMHNLIESGIEVVWFSDLTQNDVVYGICCQREEKKVTVVFRGTVNSHNWSMNLKFDTNEYRNPIKVNYPGRADELSLHSGFALYLMRKRKDTGQSKLQEIFDKIDAIGREMDPDGNYKLCITGHSLGGALATLFGFYVAAKPRFSHIDTVYIWTYAAPRVGTDAFFHAYQYLERIGRIRHARFSNSHDIVPLIPFCNFEKDDLQFYQHVGMRVQLHNTGRIGK